MSYEVQHDKERALTIVGDPAAHQVVLDLPIRYGVGRTAEDKQCICHEATFGEMISEGGILAVKRVAADAEKDGENIVGGEIVAAGPTTHGGTFGNRAKKNMIANYVAMYDLDNGEPLQPVVDRAVELGYCVYIYTTFSHNKTVTFVSEQKIEGFFKRSKRKFEKYTDAVEAYLLEREKVSGEIAASLVIDPTPIMTDGGQHYKVEHAPWPKYRVIFPLEEPFKMAGVAGATQLAQADKWAKDYESFGRRFGIDKFDKA